MGLPCCFIRLAGCPFRCIYCDTTYAREDSGEEISPKDILDRLGRFPSRLVEVTGGEPLAQSETPQLLKLLLEAGYSVLLETSGHLPIEAVPCGIMIVMDIKTPGSGLAGWHPSNLGRLGVSDAVKFVICGRDDYEWAIRKVVELDLTSKVPVYFSPAWGMIDAKALAQWIMECGLPIRLQLPLHKILWHDQKGR